MDATRSLLPVFLILCCLFLSRIHAFSENTIGKHEKGTQEEKFTGSHTADHHTAPKIILFLFGTCMLSGEFEQWSTVMNFSKHDEPVPVTDPGFPRWGDRQPSRWGASL